MKFLGRREEDCECFGGFCEGWLLRGEGVRGGRDVGREELKGRNSCTWIALLVDEFQGSMGMNLFLFPCEKELSSS